MQQPQASKTSPKALGISREHDKPNTQRAKVTMTSVAAPHQATRGLETWDLRQASQFSELQRLPRGFAARHETAGSNGTPLVITRLLPATFFRNSPLEELTRDCYRIKREVGIFGHNASSDTSLVLVYRFKLQLLQTAYFTNDHRAPEAHNATSSRLDGIYEFDVPPRRLIPRPTSQRCDHEAVFHPR